MGGFSSVPEWVLMSITVIPIMTAIIIWLIKKLIETIVLKKEAEASIVTKTEFKDENKKLENEYKKNLDETLKQCKDRMESEYLKMSKDFEDDCLERRRNCQQLIAAQISNLGTQLQSTTSQMIGEIKLAVTELKGSTQLLKQMIGEHKRRLEVGDHRFEVLSEGIEGLKLEMKEFSKRNGK